jgi:hypothetical protein
VLTLRMLDLFPARAALAASAQSFVALLVTPSRSASCARGAAHLDGSRGRRWR